MKKFYILLAMVAMMVVTGCSNADKKEDKAEKKVVSEELRKFPSWVIDPTYEDAIAAVGTAKIGNAGISFARQEAMADARAQLAQTIEVKVNTMFKSYVNAVGVAGEDGIEKVATSVSKQVASQTLKGSIQKEMDVIDGELYILVIIPNESLREETKKTVNTTLGNDKALWQEFKAEKAQDELDFAVENMLKGE